MLAFVCSGLALLHVTCLYIALVLPTMLFQPEQVHVEPEPEPVQAEPEPVKEEPEPVEQEPEVKYCI